MSVASYLAGTSVWCVPTFTPERRFDVVDLHHPLLRKPVGNALSLTRRSALIDGPNMAGKTAFLRTVGINLILAQTINVCLAREAVLPRAVVRSAIKREDKLSEGRSYFFAEISRVGTFCRAAADEVLHVFLIDEIFRGTNAVERVAGSAAVLRQLAERHMVFVSTHDSELAGLLDGQYAAFHFGDRIIDGEYGFDYVLREGPSNSRNAITLLEPVGFPAAVTREAHVLVARLNSSPSRTKAPPRAANRSEPDRCN